MRYFGGGTKKNSKRKKKKVNFSKMCFRSQVWDDPRRTTKKTSSNTRKLTMLCVVFDVFSHKKLSELDTLLLCWLLLVVPYPSMFVFVCTHQTHFNVFFSIFCFFFAFFGLIFVVPALSSLRLVGFPFTFHLSIAPFRSYTSRGK